MIIRVTALSILTLIFFSCQKELSTDNSNTVPTIPVADSSWISEITWKDSTTSTIVRKTQTFQYDNQKRLQSTLITSTYDTLRYSFYYSGNDTLPNKSVLTTTRLTGFNSNLLQRDTTILFYSFDQSGKRIKDSIISSSHPYVAPSNVQVYTVGLSVIKYSYSGNKIFGYHRDTTLIYDIFTPPYPASFSFDTATVDINDNITYGVFQTESNYYEKSNYIYDNKVSPFARFKKFRPVYLPFNMDYNFFDTYWSAYNLVKLDAENGYIGGSPYNFVVYDFTNLYSYNSGNHPIKIKSSPTFGEVIFFKYVSL
jgi:hypothetical protein